MVIEIPLPQSFIDQHRVEWMASDHILYEPWFREFTGYSLIRSYDSHGWDKFSVQFDNDMDAIEFKLRWS